MKKYITLFAFLLLLFTLSSCTTDTSDNTENSKKENQTSISDLQNQISTLTSSFDTLTTTYNTLLQNHQLTQDELDTLTSSFDTLTTDYTVLMQDYQSIQNQLNDYLTQFDSYVLLDTCNTLNLLEYRSDDDITFFELLVNNNIPMTYSTSDYGNMITSIGGCNNSDMSWLELKLNGVSSFDGVDTIKYTDGDILSFTYSPINWSSIDTTITLTDITVSLESEELDLFTFSVNSNQNVQFLRKEIADYDINFNIGYSYHINMSYDNTLWNSYSINSIQRFINDFTEIPTLSEGETARFELTFHYWQDGWSYGYDVYATDSLNVNSKTVFTDIIQTSTSEYLFMTFPDDVVLENGETYQADLIYYPFYSVCQLGFEGMNLETGAIDSYYFTKVS